jgi:hypothetical protein
MRTSAVANVIFDALLTQVDSINQVDLNQQRDTKINSEFAQNIMNELQIINPYIRDLVVSRNFCENFNNDDETVDAVTVNTRLNTLTHRMEVGIVLNQDQTKPTIYQCRTAGNQNRTLTASSREIEPLVYPLLFPCGELGWGADLKAENIQLMAYMLARLMQPEDDICYEQEDGNVFYTNRFQVMSRLGQYWLLDGKDWI